MAKLQIVAKPDSVTAPQTVTGRDAWCLLRLWLAGGQGCTPIEQPAPRWSHYVFKLRRKGFLIETIDEPHGGPFSGTHARYVLRGQVEILAQTGDER